MAKGNLILGYGRGSIGDITLYRRNGEQISRARARKVKNPKTQGQQVQRIIITTISRAYSNMKEICNHSFQGLSYGADNMNRFQKVNTDLLRQKLVDYGLDFGDSGEIYTEASSDNKPAGFVGAQVANMRGAIPNNFVISEGSLAKLDNYSLNATGRSIVIPMTLESPTYANVINALNLQKGDQLTFCVITQFNAFKYGRFILSPLDGDTNKLVTTAADNNERTINVSVTYANNALSFELTNLAAADGIVAAEQALAVGVIVSRKSSDTWLRSSCQMKILSDDVFDSLVDMNTALEDLERGNLDFTSPYYLNNANTVTGNEDGDENP